MQSLFQRSLTETNSGEEEGVEIVEFYHVWGGGIAAADVQAAAVEIFRH